LKSFYSPSFAQKETCLKAEDELSIFSRRIYYALKNVKKKGIFSVLKKK